jgi:hypothetical protein
VGGQAVVGGEVFGEVIAGQRTLAMLNAGTFPLGCSPSTTDPCACHVDMTPESQTPSAVRRYSAYGTYFEDSPATSFIYLVNVTDSASQVALSAFSEVGLYRGAYPRSGFLTLQPHAVFQASITSLFGYSPGAGYIRLEYQSSSVIGAVLNRDSVNGRYLTATPLTPDEPENSQSLTDTFFSRIQVDPGNPRATTGLLVFNPNNNTVRFVVAVTDANGLGYTSPVQVLAARGAFTVTRLSLAALFPGITSGFARVRVTTEPAAGSSARLIPLAVYRANTVVSAVSDQSKQP